MNSDSLSKLAREMLGAITATDHDYAVPKVRVHAWAERLSALAAQQSADTARLDHLDAKRKAFADSLGIRVSTWRQDIDAEIAKEKA